MSQIIDRSEHISLLTVDVGATTIIQKDSGTPHHEDHVRVTAKGISLGLGSTILLQNSGSLALTGLVNTSLLGNIDIGDNGTLVLRASISADILSNINFVSHLARATLVIDSSKFNLNGNINGFGENDVIRLGHLIATQLDYAQGPLGYGTLTLYNGSTEVEQIGIHGSYTSANFSVREVLFANGKYGAAISYVPNGAANSVALSPAARLDVAGPDDMGHGMMAGVTPHVH